MGLRQYYPDPYRAAVDAWNAPAAKRRRADARRRRDIYTDNSLRVVQNDAARIYTPEVFQKVLPFLEFAQANSLLKRVVDEIARPVYARAPLRRVQPDSAQAAYKDIVEQVRLDRVMRHASRLTLVHNDLLLVPDWLPDWGHCVHTLTPDLCEVIPHPNDPAWALAFMYLVDTSVRGRNEKALRVSDDQVTFLVGLDGQPLLLERPHMLGRLPAVEVHRTERLDSYWDEHGGADLESASRQVALLNMMLLRLQKDQSHLQIAHIGDAQSMSKPQIIDQLSVLHFESGGAGGTSNVQVLNLQATPANYIATIEKIENTVAANYGISRSRLNQEMNQLLETDDALYERTSELAEVMRDAEVDLFRLLVQVADVNPGPTLGGDATVEIDFGALATRGDRKKQLEIRATERSQGVRSVLDDIKEDNPEIHTDEAAWEKLDRNLEAEAEFIRRRRALNIPEDASTDAPGQDPAVNGAMGPAVRDGKMTRDEARAKAKGDAPEGEQA